MGPEERFRRFLRISSVMSWGTAAAAARIPTPERTRRATRGQRRTTELLAPLGTAYLATDGTMAWVASKDPSTAKALTPALLLSRFTVAAMYLVNFRRTRRMPYAFGALVSSAQLGATALLARGGRRHLRAVGSLRRLPKLHAS
jgi:hypothetical protein